MAFEGFRKIAEMFSVSKNTFDIPSDKEIDPTELPALSTRFTSAIFGIFLNNLGRIDLKSIKNFSDKTEMFELNHLQTLISRFDEVLKSGANDQPLTSESSFKLHNPYDMQNGEIRLFEQDGDQKLYRSYIQSKDYRAFLDGDQEIMRLELIDQSQDQISIDLAMTSIPISDNTNTDILKKLVQFKTKDAQFFDEPKVYVFNNEDKWIVFNRKDNNGEKIEHRYRLVGKTIFQGKEREIYSGTNLTLPSSKQKKGYKTFRREVKTIG